MVQFGIRKVHFNSTSGTIRSIFFAAPTKKHFERKFMKYSCDEVYSVVADVNNYKNFVPWCKNSIVLKSSDDKLEAELEVGFGMISEKYISKVELARPNSVVALSTQTNLLEFLRTEWKFVPAANSRGCWVNFQIEYKFRSAMYNQVSDMFFKDIVNNMVQAFENQCKKKY